ncbi:LysR substrate-binding domain-containing protein [Halopseudomonas salegens]|uniref:DNA-binding transcriptional regulator, LysR family n=1 Tax=Halopseudomonas salegens TaxID=1434072 RepID=A0A1H2HE90_9GAMM|nr:LysR substrate-binding domain-containing protein [Halopseudomonas salegens]SDU30217.1 DNA-binding transcriptional regulator, LysR family [Halopseudomonas salegens]
MQLRSLQVLLAVAETGSFVAAASRLHTVQSNITAHIKKLETELDTLLVTRGNRAALTPAGFLLKGYAERMTAAHDEAVLLLRGKNTPLGQLRIGAMETTTAFRLPPLLAAFHKAYPAIELKLTTGPTADLTTGLIEGRFDCVFIAGKLNHPGIENTRAFVEELVLVTDKPLDRLPTSAEWFSSSFLAFRQGCSYRQRIELLLSAAGVSATRIIDFGTLDAMLGCVAAGMGYALLPRSTVAAQSHRFDVHWVEIPREIALIDTYFATPPEHSWTPALRLFADAIPSPGNE